MHIYQCIIDLRYTFNGTACFLLPDCPVISPTHCPTCFAGQKFCDVPECIFIQCETNKPDEQTYLDSPSNHMLSKNCNLILHKANSRADTVFVADSIFVRTNCSLHSIIWLQHNFVTFLEFSLL